MEAANQFVRQIICSRRLPNDWQQFSEKFSSSDNRHVDLQEGVLWDYKREFPFARSNDYFGGILRLICALHNTYGGIIFFGIEDDKKRITGNSVEINIEKFNSLLRDRLTVPIECSARRYHTSNTSLDVLLVPKRPVGSPPVRFSTAIGRYPAGQLYIRQNHEVLVARLVRYAFYVRTAAGNPT